MARGAMGLLLAPIIVTIKLHDGVGGYPSASLGRRGAQPAARPAAVRDAARMAIGSSRDIVPATRLTVTYIV
jgi:hypothetical protein